MLLLGLTGSIATGKSTVSDILRSPPYSLTVVDADLIARQVVEPGTPGYAAIVSHFGPSTPDLLLPASDALSGGREDGPTGKGRPLNRPALGRRVFGAGTEADRKVLNGIVHPAVGKEMRRQMVKAYLSGCWAVVLDIPLLFESNWETWCGAVMVVAVSDPAVQLSRLRSRDPHLSEEDARNRIAAQMDVRVKARRCEARGEGYGVVVWNDGDKAQLEKEIARCMEVVRRKSPRWWSWLLLLCPPMAISAALYNYIRSWIVRRRWMREKQKEKAKL